MYVIVRDIEFHMFVPKFPDSADIPALHLSGGDFFVGYVSDEEVASGEEYVTVMVELPGSASIHLPVPFKKLIPQSLSDAEKAIWMQAVKVHAVPGGKV